MFVHEVPHIAVSASRFTTGNDNLRHIMDERSVGDIVDGFRKHLDNRVCTGWFKTENGDVWHIVGEPKLRLQRRAISDVFV